MTQFLFNAVFVIRYALIALCLLPVYISLSLAQGLDSTAEDNDQLWTLANDAYRSEQVETGHIHLKSLVDRNPGDMQLAVKCTRKILQEAERQTPGLELPKFRNYRSQLSRDHWAQYAASRLCALERMGAVSANDDNIRKACMLVIDENIHRGRLVEALELIDRFVRDNPHDPFWRISQAYVHRRLDSSKTRALYDRLRGEIDLDHPDATVRSRWTEFMTELEDDRGNLPGAIPPLPKGSPLALMEADGQDSEWGDVANQPARLVSRQIDRLAAKATNQSRTIVWNDMNGLTDPSRALDLHLLSQTSASLLPLRKLQDDRFGSLTLPRLEADTLRLLRRYRWAQTAHLLQLKLANEMLWAGRPQAALRNFLDTLNHAVDPHVLRTAQVGYWASMAQIGENSTIKQMLGDIDPNLEFGWHGKPTKASDICQTLLADREPTSRPSAPLLKDVVQHVVRIPPVSPWSSELPSSVDLSVSGQELLVSGREMLAMYDIGDLSKPKWSNLQRQHAEERKNRSYHPGYFRPTSLGTMLFERWGFRAVPLGIAAIDRATGRPLWSNQNIDPHQRTFHVPLGDPTAADGRLFYLQWAAEGDVNQQRGRRVSLVCYDPQSRTQVWDNTIVESGGASDLTGSLQRADTKTAIYGNRVTISRGAVYSNSNCGFVARSDIRDGRTDWIYFYGRNVHPANVLNLGSPPIISGSNVIFLPRDASRIFALDRRTGRLVWENPLVLGVQIVGQTDGILVVRGQASVVGLDLATGDVRWYRPMSDPVVGRAELRDSSIYLAQSSKLLRLDAATGHIVETRHWNLQDERPTNFMISGQDLYVVTNKPGDDPLRVVGHPLNPSLVDNASHLSQRLKRTWALPRHNAKVAVASKDEELHGKAYVISEGILECIDVSAQGQINWQRFIDASNPTVHFAGKTLLVIDHGGGRVPGVVDRVVAYDGTDGRTLWEHLLKDPIHSTVTCDNTLLLHDGKRRIVALDLVTGRQVWERNLGTGHMMRVTGDAERVNIFFVSQRRSAHHLTLDATSGRTVNETPVVVQPVVGKATNGKRSSDGFYGITIPPIAARYVRLVALSEVNGGGWTSIAELEVVGADGKDVARDKWKVAFADSTETVSTYQPTPEKVFDGNRGTWWHTKWTGGIPRHPHEIQIDMGVEQKITGIRYLPAVIINDNGMIQDYALYVSNDGSNWGDPVAEGFLVDRTRVDRAYLGTRGIVFESHSRRRNMNRVYHYALDSKPAKVVLEDGRLVYLKSPYFVATTRRDNEDILAAYRLDDNGYRFELGSTRLFDSNSINIEGDRIVLGRRGVLVADLAKRQFLVKPSDKNLKHNQNGFVIRAGADNLLKLVPKHRQQQNVFQFNLRTGTLSEFELENQFEQLQGQQNSNQNLSNAHFEGVILLTDKNAVTAWITPAKSKNSNKP